MYEGDFDYRKYCSWLNKKQKKNRRRRSICALMLAVCAGVLLLLLIGRMRDIPTLTAEEKSAAETTNIVLENNASENIISDAVIVENSGSDEVLPSKVEVEEKGEPIIFVDAGHGGEDEGCAREGVREKDINLSIAKLVKEKLENMGYQVVMAREEDNYITKEERVKKANSIQADIYVSIHQNAADETDVSGMEV